MDAPTDLPLVLYRSVDETYYRIVAYYLELWETKKAQHLWRTYHGFDSDLKDLLGNIECAKQLAEKAFRMYSVSYTGDVEEWLLAHDENMEWAYDRCKFSWIDDEPGLEDLIRVLCGSLYARLDPGEEFDRKSMDFFDAGTVLSFTYTFCDDRRWSPE